MLLDLSAAFDTVNHTKLLNILKHEIGIEGNALKWFTSFICGRCQRVRIGDCESTDIIIRFGVPQGSVLGRVLFNIYIRSLYKTVINKKFYIQGFADDHQIYKPFYDRKEYNIMINELPECFDEINKWMATHYLQLNPGKTEIIVFGSATILSKLQIHGAFITPSTCIRFVSTVKNLGFRLDSHLTLTPQIKSVKSSCFSMLRKIAKMKSFLSNKQCQTLVQALILYSLDYCNALYYGINSANLQQLQYKQYKIELVELSWA